MRSDESLQCSAIGPPVRLVFYPTLSTAIYFLRTPKSPPAEALQRDASELAEVGLPDVATIVLEAAASALPAHIMHCPYAETGSHNYESWQASHRRKGARS